MIETFDLISTPERISPNYGFYGLFVCIGVGFFAVGALLLWRSRKRPAGTEFRAKRMAILMIPFGMIFAMFATCMGQAEVDSARVTRSAVLTETYQTLVGCLDFFKPGKANPGKTTAGSEQWSVAGHTFAYSANQVRFAYHAVEPRDGIVHARSWVRVSFVYDSNLSRDDIVRLEVRQNVCPPAPRTPAQMSS